MTMLATQRAPRLTLRLLATATAALVLLVLAAAWAPSPARAEAACPNEQLRVEDRSTSLPDCRAYELVTPPQKNGALISESFVSHVPQIARDGRRVIATSIQCFAGPESCVAPRQSEGEPYAFARTAAGWVTHPLMPPASFETNSWWNVNADAGTALFSVPSAPQSLAEDLAGRSEQGSFVNVGPVVEGERLSYTFFGEGGIISTADLSHVVYQREKSGAEPPAWSFDHSEKGALYEYVGTGNAAPLMVGVTGGFESHALVSTCRTELGGELTRRNGSLSGDGRTVYFTAVGHRSASCPSNVPAPAAGELWARIDGELPDARSVLISGPTSEACSSTACEKNATEVVDARNANFEFASADGSRVLFTDTQQLTDGASELSGNAQFGCSEVPAGCNLYESECPNGSRCSQPTERRLIDVSEGAKEHGGPRVQGVLATSSDSSHVYFIARGVLTGEQENQSHERAQDGKDNLYVYAEGHLAFITTLPPSDELEWKLGQANSLEANATPTGRFLVFASHRALTPDDTCLEAEGEAPLCPAQVFEYDAQTKGLIRVSIGEQGFNDNGNRGLLGQLVGTGAHAGDAIIAGPHRALESGSVPLRSDPTMSDDGAFVFFQSPVALTPGALNDIPVGEQFAQNVYEYHEGHVSLISDGKDTTHESRIGVTPVELLGSDATGKNVFFTTFDPLVAQDTDTARDIYDARIEGGVPAPVSSPSCEGEACQGAPAAPPLFGAPSSSTFSGPGNPAIPPPAASGSGASAQAAAQARAAKLARALKACRTKRNKRKRATCERAARKAYGAKSAKKKK
jgi:hypothetical protein